jgi:outer membrane protein TolC
VAVGIPADLLRRRPDIRQAERTLAVQSAQIGIAKADLLPSFALLGSISLSAEKFGDLFKSGSSRDTCKIGHGCLFSCGY